MNIAHKIHKANMIIVGALGLFGCAHSVYMAPKIPILNPIVVEYLPPLPAPLPEPVASFEAAVSRVLAHEGGYADHRRDPGGPTRFGLTQARARELGYSGPMSAMPLSVATGYYRNLWQAHQLDRLDAEVAAQALDALVAHGPRAARWIHPESARACERLNQARLQHYRRSANWHTFGRGWEKRIKKNLETC